MPGVELRVRATGLARAWPVPTPRSSLPFGVVLTSACVVRFEIWYIQILITSARLHAFISSHLISSHLISSHHLTSVTALRRGQTSHLRLRNPWGAVGAFVIGRASPEPASQYRRRRRRQSSPLLGLYDLEKRDTAAVQFTTVTAPGAHFRSVHSGGRLPSNEQIPRALGVAGHARILVVSTVSQTKS
jgi:hypothetical protein